MSGILLILYPIALYKMKRGTNYWLIIKLLMLMIAYNAALVG
jgi:hypothetical protein